MKNQQYIDKAVELAVENVEKGGKPFGAVIVKNDTIVTTGINEAIQTGDLTSHAEIQAIRKAGLDGHGHKLAGATLYASGHPCPMCLSAIYLAGIKEVYYATTLEDAEKAGLGVSNVYKELKKDFSHQSIPLYQLSSTLNVEPIKTFESK